MFSHTSPPNPAPGPTSLRKHCLFLFFCFLCFSLFISFSMVLGLFCCFLLVVQWFSLVLQWFWLVFDGFYWFSIRFCYVLGVPPLVFPCFFGFRIGSARKTKGNLLEYQSQPTPGPLRSFLLGLSFLCLSLLWGSFSVTSPESLLVVWPPPGSSGSFLLLSLLWGPFSGTSPESLLVVWPPLGFSGWLWPPPCCVSFYT